MKMMADILKEKGTAQLVNLLIIAEDSNSSYNKELFTLLYDEHWTLYGDSNIQYLCLAQLEYIALAIKKEIVRRVVEEYKDYVKTERETKE